MAKRRGRDSKAKPDVRTSLDESLRTLDRAVREKRSRQYCLQKWSAFVRLRDGGCCILCGETERLAAHHIVRKSFLPEAQFQTGNGISLCGECHKEPHEAFNRRPNLQLPMDAEDGEKIDLLTCFYWSLLADARSRDLLCDEYYFLSDSVLQRFKLFQGFHPTTPFPGLRLEQAYLIWRQTSRCVLNAIVRSIGFELPDGFIQTEEIALFA